MLLFRVLAWVRMKQKSREGRTTHLHSGLNWTHTPSCRSFLTSLFWAHLWSRVRRLSPTSALHGRYPPLSLVLDTMLALTSCAEATLVEVVAVEVPEEEGEVVAEVVEEEEVVVVVEEEEEEEEAVVEEEAVAVARGGQATTEPGMMERRHVQLVMTRDKQQPVAFILV